MPVGGKHSCALCGRGARRGTRRSDPLKLCLDCGGTIPPLQPVPKGRAFVISVSPTGKEETAHVLAGQYTRSKGKSLGRTDASSIERPAYIR